MTGRTNEEGVSVIVGTLLLILITVTAAAGLAVMVSQMQKDEMDRQSHIAALESEQVQILSPGLTNDPLAWNRTPFNVTGDQSWNNWSSVTFTLSNLNTDDVRVIGIAINDHYTRNFTTVTEMPIPERVPYNVSDHDYLTIPGTKSRKLQINFTDDFSSPPYISDGEPVRIKVITSLYNVFEKSLRPPDPVFLTRIETEDLGSMQRHVLVLDGSASTADDGISGWNWTIISGDKTIPVPGSWTDTSNLTTSYSRGKIVRVSPTGTGPFRVSLKVTDEIGMTRVSDPVDIPADQNYVPVSNIYASSSLNPLNQSVVNATVKDINGKPVPGVIVNFAIGSNPYNNLTFGPYFSVTDPAGNATTLVTAGIGTIKVIYGKFPVTDVPVGL
jgi:flagellin-like protein